jgi:hypothetical protein
MSCNTETENLKGIDEEFIISFKETIIIGDDLFSITFSKVLEDSRCPINSDINCVWEGRILVEIVMNNTDKKIVGLGNLINPSSPQEPYKNLIEYNGSTIQLINADLESITLKIITI